MDQKLKEIISAAEGISSNLEKHTSIPKESIAGSKDGISLLSLKNHAMLSYLHNLAFITASQVARSSPKSQSKNAEELRTNAIQNTIKQRVALEKGVKGLEAKMAYQIEKVLRANFKATQDAKANVEKKKQTEDDDSDSDDDVLNYKPNPTALGGKSNNRKTDDKKDNDKKDNDKESAAKYQAPKISAVTPFAKDHEAKTARRQKNATMEEYLRHTSDAPMVEPSIGSNIMDQGRGGEQTQRDLKKQNEINRYEEENFTRISMQSKKKEKRAARQRQREAYYGNNFFGEDWGFNSSNKSSNSIEKVTKRKDKPSSVWERTKKRQRRG